MNEEVNNPHQEITTEDKIQTKRKSSIINFEKCLECIRRFPVTMGFLVSFAFLLEFLVHSHLKLSDETFITFLFIFLLLGVILSAALKLCNEEIQYERNRAITNIIAYSFLAINCIIFAFAFASHLDDNYDRLILVILPLICTVFFFCGPFFKEKDDIKSWNFTLRGLTVALTTNICCLILFAAFCLLIYIIGLLFGDNFINENLITHISILTFTILYPFSTLLLLPDADKKHSTIIYGSKVINGIAHYLFIPIILIYLVVIYAYIAKIILLWELPNGGIVWIVTGIMAVLIIVEYLIYPFHISLQKTFNKKLSIWLPIATLPLLVLMSIAIYQRIYDYGITINRLYTLTLNLWFYFVCIKLIISKAKRINWIAISFAVILFITSAIPNFNFSTMVKHIIISDVNSTFNQVSNVQLPLDDDTYKKTLKTLSEEDAHKLNSQLKYLYKHYHFKVVESYLTEPWKLNATIVSIEPRDSNNNLQSE